MRIRTLALAMTVMLGAGSFASAQTLGSGFTYQGLLADNGSPASGTYDFEFALYTVASGGSAVQTVTEADVPVAGGLVNTVLDFGAQTYNGQVKWVEVHVRPGGSGGAYTVLSPRQALTGAPYALGLPMPFQRNVNTGNAPAFQIQQLDTGVAIEGILPAGSDNPAVYGTAPNGVGVWGDSVSFYGTFGGSNSGVGAGGHSESSIGVYGTSTSGNGVQGDGGAVGVLGTNAANGPGVRGVSATGYGTVGESTSAAGVVGVTGSGYGVFAFGDLGATGAKTFVEPHPTDPGKEIRYAALEGPEVGTYFRGTAQLAHGAAHIAVPDDFAAVTDARGITVQLTAVGQAANLYCVKRSLDGIDIAGAPDVVFDYQVNGVRKAFADFQPVRDNEVFVPDSPDASLFSKALPRESLRRMIANGTLNADGTVNMATVRRMHWDQRPGWTDEPKRGADPDGAAP